MAKIELHDLSDRELLVLTAQRVNEMTDQLAKQNGRIDRLESWRDKALGVLGLVAFATPIISAIVVKLWT